MNAAAKPRILRTDTEVRIGERDMAYLGTLADVVTAEAWDERTLARQAKDAELKLLSFSCLTRLANSRRASTLARVPTLESEFMNLFKPVTSSASTSWRH